MNIIQVQERLKDVSDDQLQQMMQQPGAMAPEFLVMSELNRRKRMREGYEAAQAQNDTTVAQDLMAAPGIPQAVGNQMAAAMRPEGAQTRAGIAGMASGGVVGGGFNDKAQKIKSLARSLVMKNLTPAEANAIINSKDIMRYAPALDAQDPALAMYKLMTNEVYGFAEGGIVQAYKDGGAIGKGIDGVSYPTVLPQTKPRGIDYRVSDPSAADLERLQRYEEKHGAVPEATAPTQDRQSWSDWFFGLINPRSDAQRARDAYVPTVEDSNMFGYAEGGIVQAYEDGGLTGPGWMEERFGKGQLTDMAAGPATPIGPYMQQGVALGLTADQTREAYDRNIPLEGLGEYKIGFVDSPRELDAAPIVAPKPPTPVVPAVPTVTPTAKTMPAPPNVDTPPIPTAPVVSLPAASTPAMPSAPKTPAEAYTMTQVLAGAPAGDAASREARRNAFMALAKFGLTLAGSKEATAGGAIAEAGLGALGAYEAGAADIRNRALAAQKEAYQRQKDQMAMKQALSKEEYRRYRDTVKDAQIAAERGDNQAWRQAQLKLDEWKTRVAEQRAQATAEASLVSAAMKASKERADLLSQERAYLSSPGFIASIAQLPKAQQEIARQGAERRREYIDAEMNKFLGYSGLGQAPMPGTADLTK